MKRVLALLLPQVWVADACRTYCEAVLGSLAAASATMRFDLFVAAVFVAVVGTITLAAYLLTAAGLLRLWAELHDEYQTQLLAVSGTVRVVAPSVMIGPVRRPTVRRRPGTRDGVRIDRVAGRIDPRRADEPEDST